MIGRRAIAAAQVVLGLWLLVANFNQSTQAAAQFGSTAEAPPLYGIWDVVAMTIDQQVRPPLTTDDQRWRRVIVSAATSVSFQRMDDTFETFRATIDTAAKSITLSTGGNITGAVARLAFEQPSADQLVIEGPIDGKKIRMELHRVDHTAFTLLQSRFRWIQDYPYLARPRPLAPAGVSGRLTGTREPWEPPDRSGVSRWSFKGEECNVVLPSWRSA